MLYWNELLSVYNAAQRERDAEQRKADAKAQAAKKLKPLTWKDALKNSSLT